MLKAAHVDRPLRDDVAKTELADQYKLDPAAEKTYQGEPLPDTTTRELEGVWSFRDENAALHLLRNALGHGDEWVRRRLLSLRGSMVRSYRNDTTVMLASDQRQDCKC